VAKQSVRILRLNKPPVAAEVTEKGVTVTAAQHPIY